MLARREVGALTRGAPALLAATLTELREKARRVRRALELLLGRVVEIVVFEAASAASRCTHPSDISTWAQSMRRARVGLMARESCVRLWKRVSVDASRRGRKASMEVSRKSVARNSVEAG